MWALSSVIRHPAVSLRFKALSEAQKERCYFFGSFNPVTGTPEEGRADGMEGHVNLAVRAQKQLGFKQMVFVPVFSAPHKDPSRFAAFKHRVQMIWNAFQGKSGLVVSEIEKGLNPPSFTVQTLRALIPDFDTREEKIPFLIGADALKGLTTWREGKLLAQKLLFVASPRDGEKVPESLDFDGERVPLAIEPVNGCESPASSTMVRDRVAKGESIAELVAPGVADYIQDHRLYQPQNRLQRLWQQFSRTFVEGLQEFFEVIRRPQ